MPARIALLALLLVPLVSAGRAQARADERVFDPHYWAHPHFIDPSYDFRAPPKPAHEEIERPVELAGERRVAPSSSTPRAQPKR